MGRPKDERLTQPISARDVCQRTGSKAMLAGSIASLGSQYVIGLNARQLPHRRLPRQAAGGG